MARNVGPTRDPFETAKALAISDPRRRTRLSELAGLAQKSARGRIAFIIDATSSRANSWKEASAIQARMVAEANEYGKLAMRVVSFGGLNVASHPGDGWAESADEIVKHMEGINCVAGTTLIVPSVESVLAITPLPTIIVLIGDAFEEELSALRSIAAVLKAKSIPVFAFQENDGPAAEEAFRMLARETGGVFARFGAKLDLSSLMVAAAAYATGGKSALIAIANRNNQKSVAAAEILKQLAPPRR